LVERLLYTQDVGGSSPSPPTSLRACGASAGKPASSAKAARRSPQGEDGPMSMKYVYLLQSIDHPDETYVGLTEELDQGSPLTMQGARLTPPNSSHGAW
jgi:hypothetical protein